MSYCHTYEFSFINGKKTKIDDMRVLPRSEKVLRRNICQVISLFIGLEVLQLFNISRKHQQKSKEYKLFINKSILINY